MTESAPKMLTREIVFALRWKICDICLSGCSASRSRRYAAFQRPPIFCESFHVTVKIRRESPNQLRIARIGRVAGRARPLVGAAVHVMLEPFELDVRLEELMAQSAPLVALARSNEELGRHAVRLQCAKHLDCLR